jgi:hypothetical protein
LHPIGTKIFREFAVVFVCVHCPDNARHSIGVYANFGQKKICSAVTRLSSMTYLSKNNKNIEIFRALSHCKTCSYIAPVKNLTQLAGAARELLQSQ